MRIALIFAVAALLSGCATGGRLLSYGYDLADASYVGAAGPVSIYVHPKDDTLLLQPKLGAGLAARGAALIYAWRSTAEGFVAPVGCGISEVKALSVDGASWEATYVCPPGVDLRGLIMSQRSDLRRGVPLHR